MHLLLAMISAFLPVEGALVPVEAAFDFRTFGAVAAVGDVDGDGVCDLLMGPRVRGRDRSREGGDTWLISGARGEVLWNWPDEALRTPGASVAGIGDVNADGVPDLVIGAPGHATGRGLVRVYSGYDGALLWEIAESAPHSGFGFVVDATGDVDGDGVRDLAAGEPELGVVRLFSGRDGALLWSARHGAPGARFGSSLSIARDVDGDGRCDVLVGAPLDGPVPDGPRVGAVRLLSGSGGSLLRTWTGTSPVQRFGDSVVLLDDLTGDGAPDVLVGASRPDPVRGQDPGNAGLAVVYNGATGTETRRWAGDATDSEGFYPVPIGDVDGDARVDLALCSPRGFLMLGTIGMVEVVSGSSGASLAEFMYPSGIEPLACDFPQSAAALGDVDGDGSPDVACTLSNYGGADARGLCVISARGELIYSVSLADLVRFKALKGDARSWPEFARRTAVTFGAQAFRLAVEPGGPPLLVIGQPGPAGVAGVWVVDVARERVVLAVRDPASAGGELLDVRRAPDWDGDGREDLALCRGQGARQQGVWTLVSSRTGEPLSPRLEGELLGFHDMDGDHRPEVFLKASPRSPEFRWANPRSSGRALFVPWSVLFGELDDDSWYLDFGVFEPRGHGRILYVRTSTVGGLGGEHPARGAMSERFQVVVPGTRTDAAGVVDDVDRDGVRDLWVIAKDGVRLLSGRNGRELAHMLVPAALGGVAITGDLDGDDIRDVLVGAPDARGGRGLVMAFSSATGEPLCTFEPPEPERRHFGTGVALGVDVNGDGVRDPIVSGMAIPEERPGHVWVIDGASGAVLVHLDRPRVLALQTGR